jgi:hypothetical protein
MGSIAVSAGSAASAAYIGLFVIATACASTAHVADDALETPALAPRVPAPVKPAAWANARETASNGGTYRVLWRTSPDVIPRGQTFAIDAWVFAADDPKQAPLPLTNVKLDVDATMPEHGHGMNRIPKITRRDDGGFHVEGLLFHMPGRWELYLDVTSGAITERAQVKLELE